MSNEATKKERGRLKKLRSRADFKCCCKNENGTSGIISFAEAEELKELLKKLRSEDQINIETCNYSKLLAPSIHLNKADPSWQSSDGIDHQMLMNAIIFQSGMSHQDTLNLKRKRKESTDTSCKLPSWARLHNPAFAQSVAVLEFQISLPTSDEEKDQSAGILPSNRLPSESNTLSRLMSNDGFQGRRAVPSKCKLFQDHRPHHATECLLYIDEKKTATKKKRKLDDEVDDAPGKACPIQSIFKKMEGLIHSKEDLIREGFPFEKASIKVESYDMLVDAAKTLKRNETGRVLVNPNGDVERLLQPARVAVMYPADEPEDPPYVSTCLHRNQIDEAPSGFKVFAIDCEMVLTKAGHELARVTVLEYSPTDDDLERYITIMDTLVKPKHRVLDYLTKFSGITQHLLEGVTTSLEEIQATIISFIFKEDIVVAHSAENDLKALQLIHHRIIDTAILFREAVTRRKHSLKHLSLCLLKKKIQGDALLGHCSEEDAAASLRLAIRRARLGDDFKLHDKPGKKSLLTVITQLNRASVDDKPPFLKAGSGKIVCIAPSDWIREQVGNQSAANALECESIASSSINAISSYLQPGPRRACFLWSRLVVNSKELNTANQKIDEILVSFVFTFYS